MAENKNHLTQTRPDGGIGRALASLAADQGLKPDSVKSMTFKIDTCHYLAWHSALLR